MDVENPVDRLIIDESEPWADAQRIAVIDDPSGELTRAVARRSPSAVVVTHADSWVDEQAVSDAVRDLSPQVRVESTRDLALANAELVLARLPREVDAVGSLAEDVAVLGAADARIVGGARVKHLVPAMNDALARGFDEVRGSLGRNKSRVLHACAPKDGVNRSWPRSRFVAELGFEVFAQAGVFAGTRVDRGTRLLLSALAEWSPPDGEIVDIGCGTGILATWLARSRSQVVATDTSAAAVASASLTVDRAGVPVRVTRGEGLSAWADGSVAALVSNPPFHVGAAKDSTPTLRIIDDAARVLQPGGELMMVWNAHLPYLQHLRRIGSTEVVQRDHRYLVTRTVTPGHAPR